MLNVKKMFTKICNELSIASFTKGTANTGGLTFNLPNNYRGVFWVNDSAAANCGEYMVFTTGSGVVNTKAISAASNLTINTSTNNKITFTPSTGTRILLFLNIQNKATI